MIQNVGSSMKHLSINLIAFNNMLTSNVEVSKLDMAVYDILLNTSELNEVIRCE